MNLYLLQQYQFIQKLYNNNNYMDILLNIDDFFDILHLYAYKNWLEAEVVDVKFMKYFTSITLKTNRNDKDKEKDCCPDPQGGILLTKYDCKVEYTKTFEKVPCNVSSQKDMVYDKKTGKYRPKMVKNKIWIVDIMIPNKFLINDVVYDLQAIQEKLDDEKDINDVESTIINPSDNAEQELQQ